MFNLPKAWFKDTVSYVVEGQITNEWDVEDEEVVKPITLVNNVRFSGNLALNKTHRDNTDIGTAVLYVHPTYSSFKDFEKGQKILFNGQEYTILRITPYSQPTSTKIHHWRLELI